MSTTPSMPRWLRLLEACYLWCYPRAFAREHRAEFRAAALHRWQAERARAGSLLAALRTLRVLLADTLHAAPAAHREAARLRRAQPDPARGRGGLLRWLGGAWVDARIALRSHRKRPGYALLVIVTLGLGIGANAALFGALDRVLLRPLPFENGDRMVYLALRAPQRGWQIAVRETVMERWRAGARSIEWLVSYQPAAAVWTGAGQARTLPVTNVSSDLAERIGIRAVIGRIPTGAEVGPAAPPTVLIGESFWRREFGADPGVLGRTMTLNDTVFTIAGVWPASARLELSRVPDLVRVMPADVPREGAFSYTIALARPGVGVDQIEHELTGLTEGVPDMPPGWVAAVNPPYGLIAGIYVEGLWVVFGSVVILLLVALANVANLLMDRALARAGELGVRAAIGAGRPALIRLFLVESAALTALGIVVAVAVAWAGGRGLAAITPDRLPVLEGATGETRVLLYATLLAIVSVAVCTIAPLTQLRRMDVKRLLGSAGDLRTTARAGIGRAVLVAAQVSLAAVLVAGSSLALRSYGKLVAVDPGPEMDELVQFALSLPQGRYPTPEARTAFWQQVVEQIEAIPGVRGITGSGMPLLRFSVYPQLPRLEGEPASNAPDALAFFASVFPGYFDVTGLRIVEGRDFQPDDNRPVIVNESFARSRGGNVVGRRLTWNDSTFHNVVGVVADARSSGLDPAAPQIWMPTDAFESNYERFMVRTAGSPAALVGAIRERIAALDPNLPFRELETGREIMRESTARHRFLAQILAVFGGLAMLLAVTGVYGVVGLDVSRRRREMGIRFALGAGVRRVTLAVLALGLRPVVLGLVAGTLVAFVLTRYLESLLYELSARDPLSLTLATAVLLAAAALACWLPARRAGRVDPVEALRSE